MGISTAWRYLVAQESSIEVSVAKDVRQCVWKIADRILQAWIYDSDFRVASGTSAGGCPRQSSHVAGLRIARPNGNRRGTETLPSRARQPSVVTIVGSCHAWVLASEPAFSAARSCRRGVELAWVVTSPEKSFVQRFCTLSTLVRGL